jgi:hypothetical protein
MAKKIKPDKPSEIPHPGKRPEIDSDKIPENPVSPEEEPDIIPEEDPFETPPEELPVPGEGP